MSLWRNKIAPKILSIEALTGLATQWRDNHKKVVLLSGAFDLVHLGHLEILYQASLQGDLLLVALNSDQSIQEYKGRSRPIYPLEERLALIASLGMVDFVVSFEEHTPCQLITVVKPSIFVNGSEYGQDCIEKKTVEKHGGKLFIVERIPPFSSTNVIKKILSSCV